MAADTILYRDAVHIVYQEGSYYVLLNLRTRLRRIYVDFRDVLRALRRGVENA